MKYLRQILWATMALFTGLSMLADQKYVYKVGLFQKLKINYNINVIYKCLPDSAGYAVYTAPEGNADIFSFTNKGNGQLKVNSNVVEWDNNFNLPTLYLYSDFLSAVESSSEESVVIENPVPCASFTARLIGNGNIDIENLNCNNLTASILTGNGSINVSGKCLQASYKMLGAGLISADRMQAENVKCTILGTGSIGCWAIDNLNVKGIGTTKIYYKGKPNIKKTGGGKLFELPGFNSEADYQKLGTPVHSFAQPANIEEEEAEVEESEEIIFDPDYEDNPTIVTGDD